MRDERIPKDVCGEAKHSPVTPIQSVLCHKESAWFVIKICALKGEQSCAPRPKFPQIRTNTTLGTRGFSRVQRESRTQGTQIHKLKKKLRRFTFKKPFSFVESKMTIGFF